MKARRSARAQNVLSRLADEGDGITAGAKPTAGWKLPAVIAVSAVVLVGIAVLTLKLLGVF